MGFYSCGILFFQELVQREDWNMYVQVTRTSKVRHLAMSTTKILLEWTKAVIFIITVVCILLVFGLEKGLKNYTPSTTYLIITGIYYMLTEKVFVDILFKTVEHFRLDYFESMEKLYFPVLQKSLQLSLSLALTVTCFMLGHIGLGAFSSFTNIRAKYYELDNENLSPLISYLKQLSMFRHATTKELNALDDVCAVCLHKMTSARITPCQHYFHAECLRRALHESAEKCPICQFPLPIPIIIENN